MEAIPFKTEDVYQAALGGVLLATGTTFIDVIIDWITERTRAVIDAVTSYVGNLLGQIQNNLTFFFGYVIPSFFSRLDDIRQRVADAYQYVINIYHGVTTWLSTAYATVSSAVSSAVGVVWTWLQSTCSSITSFVNAVLTNLWQNISSTLSSFWASLYGLVSQISANVSGVLGSWGATIVAFFKDQATLISGFWSAWYAQRAQDVTNIIDYMAVNVVPKITQAFNLVTDVVTNPGKWVGKIFDAAGAWLTTDIPGHSPRWTGIFEAIGHWFATWFYEFPKYFFGDFPENVAYGLATSFQWVTDLLTPMVGGFLTSIDQFAHQIGPISPSMAGTNTKSIISIGMGVIGGLFSMTVAGELLHPLKQIGLGNLAAMVYDMTNYKLLTGAFVGALSYAMIRKPAGYYYNELFRPNLPNERTASLMYSKDLITRDEFGTLLGYEGFANTWHDKFADEAYFPPSLYTLASLANTGVFDEDIFAEILRDRGLKPKFRTLLLAMYRSKSLETTKGLMSSVAITRFKEGMTDESGFSMELQTLRYTDKEIPLLIAGSRLSYATDYTTDLMLAYEYGVRAGNLSLAEYRQALLDLGLVPERVEGKVLIERARIKPKEALTPIGVPGEIYLTDQGKVALDTIRRRRTKNTITHDQEIVALLDLGVPVDYATTLADNDDAVLLEKVDLEPVKVVPLYKTDAGKVELETIRDTRRKNTIDRIAELTMLSTLEIPDYLATAIADNDDVALMTKVPTGIAPQIPSYETDAGKIQTDTIRRQRRKRLITREDELAQLRALAMPDWLGKAIVENDDTRLEKKVTGE